MDLLNMLLNQGGGNAVRQLAANFGLSEEQTASAVSNLVPALGQGLAQNASTPDGLAGLLGALTGGGHQRYLEDPSVLVQEETVRDGNAILGHILGSKDVSRQVAQQASESTGVGADILKKMLPVVATMVMGNLSRQTTGAGAAQSASLTGLLGQFMQGGGQESALGGILGMASKIFQK